VIDRSEIVIRKALPEDLSEVIRLLTKLGLVLPDAENPEVQKAFWERFWATNPYYQYFDDEVSYGWIMEHHNRIVGYFGFLPRVYLLNGKVIPMCIASLWGVELEYRTHTELLSDLYFRQNTISLKLATTAIRPTGLLFDKYGGREVPCPELADVYVIPIDINRLIKFRFSNQMAQSGVFRLLVRITGVLLSPWKYKFGLIPKNKNISIIDIKDLPKDFDEWVNKNLKDKKGLIASRDSVILKWFYSDRGAMFKRIFFVYSQNNRTMGFGALVEDPVISESNLVRYKVVDLIAETPRIKKQLIRAMIRNAYHLGGHVLEFHHSGMIKRSEIPEFTIRRSFRQFPLHYQTPDKQMDELLKNPENWNIMPYDGDTSFI